MGVKPRVEFVPRPFPVLALMTRDRRSYESLDRAWLCKIYGFLFYGMSILEPKLLKFTAHNGITAEVNFR